MKSNTLSLGHQRLSIIDLDSRSNQPMQFEEFSIVYNGEIYNYNEGKKALENENITFDTTSDTEVFIKIYKMGVSILEKINGMFAFAAYDTKKNSVFIARDRLGIKPLYYKWDNGILELCSQINPISGLEVELDKTAIDIYLATGYIPSPKSIYDDIEKLSAGHYGLFDLNKKTKDIKIYWNLKSTRPKIISYQKSKE